MQGLEGTAWTVPGRAAWPSPTGFLAHARADPAFLREMEAAYDVWGMEADLASARTAAVLTLGLHCLLTEQIVTGKHLKQALEGTTAEQVVEALRTRPEHEFFASVPDGLGAPDQELLSGLKDLAYSEHGPTKVQWVRMSYQAREALRHYAASLPAHATGHPR